MPVLKGRKALFPRSHVLVFGRSSTGEMEVGKIVVDGSRLEAIRSIR